MGQLTNLYVSSSYQGLIKLANSQQGVTGTLQYTQDGAGNNLPIQISDTQVNITGSFTVNGVPVTSGSSGTSGTSGTSGSSGSSGTSGTSGQSGSSGTSGTSGSSGSSGTSGQNGSSGTSGTSGVSGSSGTSGSSGNSGSSGTSGSSGVSGSSGTSGVSGSSGTSGSSGSSGTSGAAGASGSSGTSGTSGANGSSGTSGNSGSSGTSGTSGQSGSSGTSGISGSSGTSGISGSSGTSGTSGANGSSGTSGTSGTSGQSGSSGTSGTSGNSGSSGTSGSSGVSGSSGTSGTSGTSGATGSSGTSGTSGVAGTSGTSGTSPIVDTGMFATTGSNNFKGQQYITEGNGLTLALNTDNSGSAYPNVSNYVDQTTDPANVYASYQLIDANTSAGFGFAKSSYTTEYGGQTVDIIVGGGTYLGSDTAMVFKGGFVHVPRPLNVTGSLSVYGTTHMSASDAYPLNVSGTIRTQRIHYMGNPFNNLPSSNLAAHRIDGLNESFNTTMYDLANNTTASYVRQTVNTGSNFVRTILASQNAGFDAILNLANYAGNGLLTSNVNTEITGTLKIANPSSSYAQVELSGSVGGGILQSKGDLYVQGHVFGDTTSIGDVILTATGSKSVRVTSNTFNVTSNTNVTGTFNVQGTSKFTGSINGSSDLTIQGLASFDAGKVAVQDSDGSSPKVAIGTGNEPYPGMGVVIDTDKNPGNIYSYFAIDDFGSGSANKGGMGLSVQTFTAYGSDTVGALYGGQNGNDGTNTIIYSVGGTAQIPKNVGITGSLAITGSVNITGSVQGNVNALSISSNTASLNLNNGNFFTLQLVSGSATHINPSNIKPGQTVNIRLNTTGSGTVTFPSSVKQVSGSSYVPTTTTGVDIITLVSFDTTSLYLANVKNLI